MARGFLFSLFDEAVELGVIQINDVEPHLQHIVYAPLAESCPHGGIWVVRVGGGVVVDTDHVQHGAGGQQRRSIVRIDVINVPVEIEVIDGTQDFGGVV